MLCWVTFVIFHIQLAHSSDSIVSNADGTKYDCGSEYSHLHDIVEHQLLPSIQKLSTQIATLEKRMMKNELDVSKIQHVTKIQPYQLSPKSSGGNSKWGKLRSNVLSPKTTLQEIQKRREMLKNAEGQFHNLAVKLYGADLCTSCKQSGAACWCLQTNKQLISRIVTNPQQGVTAKYVANNYITADHQTFDRDWAISNDIVIATTDESCVLSRKTEAALKLGYGLKTSALIFASGVIPFAPLGSAATANIGDDLNHALGDEHVGVGQTASTRSLIVFKTALERMSGVGSKYTITNACTWYPKSDWNSRGQEVISGTASLEVYKKKEKYYLWWNNARDTKIFKNKEIRFLNDSNTAGAAEFYVTGFQNQYEATNTPEMVIIFYQMNSDTMTRVNVKESDFYSTFCCGNKWFTSSNAWVPFAEQGIEICKCSNQHIQLKYTKDNKFAGPVPTFVN